MWTPERLGRLWRVTIKRSHKLLRSAVMQNRSQNTRPYAGSSVLTGGISREGLVPLNVLGSAENPQIPHAVLPSRTEEDMVHRTKETISEIPCQVNCQNCLNIVVT